MLPGASRVGSWSCWRSCGLILVVLLAGGCGRAQTVYVKANDTIHPLADGPEGEPVARPVTLRLYQLKDHLAFANAEFEPLWRDAEAVLGDDLLGEPQVVTVHPGDGQEKPRRIALKEWAPEARSLGVMALCERPDADADRRRVVVSAWHADDYVIQIDGNSLSFHKH